MGFTVPLGISTLVVAVGRLLVGGDDRDRGASLYFYLRKKISRFRNSESAKSHICLEVPSGGFLFSAIALSKGLAPELGTQVSVLIYCENTHLPNLRCLKPQRGCLVPCC